jgi:hypothetical protein
VLRQILERELYRELGFGRFEEYVVERLDLSARTARRLVRLAHAPEAVATAFHDDRWICTAPACSARRNLHRQGRGLKARLRTWSPAARSSPPR